MTNAHRLNEYIQIAAAHTREDSIHALKGIHLRFGPDGQARLEATDSYRAVRINLGHRPGEFSYAIQQAGGGVWNPGKIHAWDAFMAGVEPSETGVNRFDEVFVGVDAQEHRFPMSGMGPHRTLVSDFGYFDGNRRRPQGIIGLSVMPASANTLDLRIKRGMRVFGDNRVKSFLAWEEVELPIGTLVDDDGFSVPSGDTSYEYGQLGVYSADYLSGIDRATSIGWSGRLKPIAYNTHSGNVERLVMPIRL